MDELTPEEIQVVMADWERDKYYGRTKDTSSINYIFKAQLAKSHKDRPELREKLASLRVLTEHFDGYGINLTYEDVDQILALIPDSAEAFIEGYNMGAQDADADNKENEEEIRKQMFNEIEKIAVFRKPFGEALDSTEFMVIPVKKLQALKENNEDKTKKD